MAQPLPPCTQCGAHLRRTREPARPGAITAGARGMCSRCSKKHPPATDTAVIEHTTRHPLADAHLPPAEITDQARCAQADPEEFFPNKGESTKTAKLICGMCPVVEQCLDFAVTTNQRHGVWGGKSERERRHIRIALAGQEEAA